MANLRNNGLTIGDPCRPQSKNQREDREDSDEEQHLHIDFLKILYPHKYAAKEVREATRLYNAAAPATLLPFDAVLASSSPSVASDASVLIDPALTQYI